MTDQASTDFAALLDAEGSAARAPEFLAGLLESHESAHERALDYLESCVLAEGLPWTATGPVALAVADILDDPRSAPVRVELLTFLGMVASSVTQFETTREELEQLASPGGRDVAGELAALAADGGASALSAIDSDDDLAQGALAVAILGCVAASSRLLEVSVAFEADDDAEVAEAAADASEELRELLQDFAA